MKHFLTLCFIICQLSYYGVSQTLSLQECLKEALRNNYSIETERIDRQISINNYQKERSKYLPQISGNLTYFNYPGDLPLYIFPETEGSVISEGTSRGVYPVPLGLRNNYTIGLNFEQTLFDADYFLKTKSSELIQSTNQLMIEKTEEEIIFTVAKTYFEILKTQKKSDLIYFNQKRLEKSEKIVRTQIENQIAQPIELEELQIRQKQLDIQLQKLKSGLAKQTNYLKFLMGHSLDETLELVMDSTDFTGLSDTSSIDQNPSKILLKKNILANELRQKSIINEKLPELKAFAYLKIQSQGENINPFSEQQYWYNPSTIGLTLDIPIMNGFKRNTRLENLRLEQEKNKILAEQSDQYLKMTYQNNISDLQINKSTLEEKKLDLEIQKKIFNQKKDMFDHNLVTIHELFEQEAKLITAENEKVDAYFDYFIAQLDLLKTTGALKQLLK